MKTLRLDFDTTNSHAVGGTYDEVHEPRLHQHHEAVLAALDNDHLPQVDVNLNPWQAFGEDGAISLVNHFNVYQKASTQTMHSALVTPM